MTRPVFTVSQAIRTPPISPATMPENWARESFPVDIPDEALDLSQYGYQLLNGMEEEQEYIVSQLD